MFDGSIQNPFAILLFALAFVASIPLMWANWRKFSTSEELGLARLGFTGLLVCWFVLIPLLVLDTATGEHMHWLFGYEGRDTGLVEFSTFGFFLLAAIASALLACRSNSVERVFYVMACAAAVYIAGEEVSWGQWLFHWSSPEIFADYNLQKETNTHNFLSPSFFADTYTTGGWAIIITVAAVTRFRNHAEQMLAPVSVICESSVARALTLTAAVLMQHPFVQELSELALGFAGFYTFLWLAKDASGRVGMLKGGVSDIGRSIIRPRATAT